MKKLRSGFVFTLAVSAITMLTAVVFQRCSDDDGGSHTQTVTVTTFAGSEEGYAEGQGTAAQFASPQGVATDADGNVYVGDFVNNRIRMITPDETVSLLAGNGDPGNANGSADVAEFNLPYGVAVKGDGTVYVADFVNYQIRRITSQSVWNYAGSTEGYENGTTTAKFHNPAGVAVDSDGIVYVAELNNVIRKITVDGTVSTLAGSPIQMPGDIDGTAIDARFSGPEGIAIGEDGSIYIADTQNDKIRKITISDVGEVTVSTFAGTGTEGYADGEGTEAQFNKPKGVAVDIHGNVYVADTGNHRIRKITTSAEGVVTVTTLAGSGTVGADGGGFADGKGDVAQFKNPAGVAVDLDGNIYVADTDNHKIRKITIQ